MKKLMMAMFAFIVLSACDAKGSREGSIERASAEQEAARDVDNKNLKEKAEQMEVSLAKQHQLLSSLEGEFEGPLMVNRSPARTKLTVARNLPEYKGSRVRQLSEIEYDLNNLRLNIQAQVLDPFNSGSTLGCSYANVKPDFNIGYIELGPNHDPDCNFSYRIFLNVGGLPDPELRNLVPSSPRWNEIRTQASAIALRLNSGEIRQVDELVGAIQSNNSANPFNFSVKRSR